MFFCIHCTYFLFIIYVIYVYYHYFYYFMLCSLARDEHGTVIGLLSCSSIIIKPFFLIPAFESTTNVSPHAYNTNITPATLRQHKKRNSITINTTTIITTSLTLPHILTSCIFPFLTLTTRCFPWCWCCGEALTLYQSPPPLQTHTDAPNTAKNG